jgi:alkylhydroperoxidase/carboxymuconolactone decarboxylase family protein YurZ
MKIDYHTTTCIWLHLEEFYNKGLTPDEAKEVLSH